jgi:hypothetical protein
VEVREDVEVWEGDVFYGMSTQYVQVRKSPTFRSSMDIQSSSFAFLRRAKNITPGGRHQGVAAQVDPYEKAQTFEKPGAFTS